MSQLDWYTPFSPFFLGSINLHLWMGHGQGTGASDSCQHVGLAHWKLSCIPWKNLEKKHYPWTPLSVADSHRKYNLPKELMDNVT